LRDGRFRELSLKKPDDCRIIIEMAKQYYNVPPCIMARMILKSYLSLTLTGNAVAAGASKCLTSPESIEDKVLSANIACCVEIDHLYSPQMDVVRQYHLQLHTCLTKIVLSDVGIKYEKILQQKLDEANIPYCSEEEMRAHGYPKTPDICLLEPVAIDGIVVKWIESKAWFGDPVSHAAYLRDQYWPYYNRFGPGMVIYWYGLVEEIDAHRQKGIMVEHDLDLHRIERIESPYLAINSS
jgi:hypothetical protein